MAINNRIFGVVAMAAGLALAAPAVAQDGDFGGLDDVLTTDTVGDFAAVRTETTYTITNTTDDNSYRIFYVSSNSKAAGARAATVHVALADANELSHAGVLFGYIDDPRSFFIFALEEGNRVSLWQLTADDATLHSTTVTDAVREGEVNELSVVETGDQVTLSVNGEVVGMLGGLDGMGDGQFGVAVWGRGTFTFHGFSQDADPSQSFQRPDPLQAGQSIAGQARPSARAM